MARILGKPFFATGSGFFPVSTDLDWRAELDRWVELAVEIGLDGVARRVRLLRAQIAMGKALRRSTALMRESRYEEALRALDGFEGAAPPRIVHQRAVLLLRLERFDEAEEVAAPLRGGDVADRESRELLGSFERANVSLRLAAATRLLRDGETERAKALLEALRPTDEAAAVEVAYCRAYAGALDAYRLDLEGRRAEALERLEAAFSLVERASGLAAAREHAPLLELYARLDKDLDDWQERRHA